MSEEIDSILSDPSSDPELRSLLGHAREDLPDAGRVEAMWTKLAPILPPSGGGGGTGGGGGGGAGGDAGEAAIAATSSAKMATGTKIAFGVVLAATLGGGILATRSSDEPVRAVSSVVLVVPSTTAPIVEPTELVTQTPAPSVSVAVVRARVSPSASTAVDDRTEIEILRDAQSALGSDPARALRLASEAEQKYPNGQLGQEREMIRIQALFAQGKRTDARARADAFRARFPTSAHLTRLEDLFR